MAKLTGLDLKRGPVVRGARPRHVAEEGTPHAFCCRICCTWDMTNAEVEARQKAARDRWAT